MLDKRGKLASVEGVLTDLLLKLEVTEAQRLVEKDPEKRRRKLVKMALRELRKLDEGDDDAAMSLDGFSDGQQAAVLALQRRMGVPQ